MSKRIVWLTDPHLNFLAMEEVERFMLRVAAAEPDGVLISGDIAEAHDVLEYLELMRESWGVPIYFVLGNHDYYYGRIHELRAQVTEYCRIRPDLHFLTNETAPLELAPGVGLVGHDGWADGRLGSYERSFVSMMDHEVIADFRGLNKAQRWPLLKRLADEGAAQVERLLPTALQRYDHVLFVTHLPPTRESCWHEGRLSDDHWAPHFTCKAVGDALLRVMYLAPERRLTVLCGHTHGQGLSQPAPNVEILTGGAEYGRPAIQRVFEF